MKIFIIVAVTFVVTAGLVLGGVFLWSGRGKAEPPMAVRMEQPARGDLLEVVSAPGMVDPKTKVSLSAKVSARIVELPFKEGQSVTKGDPAADPPVPPSVLVRLDDKDLQADLTSALARREAQAAQIEVAKARLDTQQSSIDGIKALLADARRTLDREQALLKSKVNSEAVVDQAQCQADKLQADLGMAESTLLADRKNLEVLQHILESMDADVHRCRDNLAYAVISSPIDGVVTRVKAEVGEMAVTGTMNNPGTEILQVADLSKMLVVAEIDEANVAQVKPGQRARVHMQAYGDRVFQGVVESIALVNSTTLYTRAKYFETRVMLDTRGERIYSGLTADVDIETSCHANVLKVPTQSVVGRRVDDLPPAIRQDNPNVLAGKTETPVVYRFLGGKAVVTPVKIGPADATHTVILAGLGDQDRIVVGPYKALEKLRHDQSISDDRKAPGSQPASQPGTQPASASAPARP